jgi:hypothetical protein
MNGVMESSNEGWKTLDAAWFDTKTREEGEVFLVKVSFAERIQTVEQRRKRWCVSGWKMNTNCES